MLSSRKLLFQAPIFRCKTFDLRLCTSVAVNFTLPTSNPWKCLILGMMFFGGSYYCQPISWNIRNSSRKRRYPFQQADRTPNLHRNSRNQVSPTLLTPTGTCPRKCILKPVTCWIGMNWVELRWLGDWKSKKSKKYRPFDKGAQFIQLLFPRHLIKRDKRIWKL